MTRRVGVLMLGCGHTSHIVKNAFVKRSKGQKGENKNYV